MNEIVECGGNGLGEVAVGEHRDVATARVGTEVSGRYTSHQNTVARGELCAGWDLHLDGLAPILHKQVSIVAAVKSSCSLEGNRKALGSLDTGEFVDRAK